MIPWYAWAYLLLLALIAGYDLLAGLRARARPKAMLLRLAAMVVVMTGVVFFHRGQGAGMLYMLLLFLAVLVLAQASVAAAHRVREQPVPVRERLATALGGLATLPAIGMGAIAVWVRQGV
ncbi:hypothetical protein ACOPJQ_03690 [Luteimonas dalianensis]|uniref:hypothetical protein n=1 Tax=Luteimonas dalianensis TaxID=1148196 RepID=UPI003BF21697